VAVGGGAGGEVGVGGSVGDGMGVAVGGTAVAVGGEGADVASEGGTNVGGGLGEAARATGFGVGLPSAVMSTPDRARLRKKNTTARTTINTPNNTATQGQRFEGSSGGRAGAGGTVAMAIRLRRRDALCVPRTAGIYRALSLAESSANVSPGVPWAHRILDTRLKSGLPRRGHFARFGLRSAR